jgi:predicted RND superfamily exporter protein
MWVYYGGKKSIDEVAKKDNSILGFIVVIILGFILFYSFK